MSKLNLSKVGRVCVTVADTDRAIDFYVDTLGFEKVVDTPMGPGMRWVEVALPGKETTIATGVGYFGVSFNNLLVRGVFGLTVGVPLSVST